MAVTTNPESVPATMPKEASRLWSSLPPGMASTFRPHADRMARAIVHEVQRSVPEYAQPLKGAFGQYITEAVHHAILHCIDSIENPNTPTEDWAQLFRHLGKVEFSEGRSLNALQASYRVGGRAAWRYVTRVQQTLGLPAEYLPIAGEAIFAYIDELSALSVQGYTSAQTRAAGTTARRRRKLLDMILSGPAASSTQALSALAEAVNWRVPEQVCAVALEKRADQHAMATPEFDSDVLVDLESDEPCLLVSNPDPELIELQLQLGDWQAAVGPTVPLGDAAYSLRLARRAITLAERGVIESAPVLRCSEHLMTLLLLQDEFLTAQLNDQCLAPFADLTNRQRARLQETLLAWLQSNGSAPEIAKRLGVHPQTVRYRLRQLEQLFGERLHDPDNRFEMEIALRAQHLLLKKGRSFRGSELR